MTGNRFRRLISAGTLAALLALPACHGADQADREAALARANAARLVGVWDVTLILDRPLTQLIDAHVTAPKVVGTMAFTENRSGDFTYADFGEATDKGVYDLDLTVFGMTLGDDGRLASVIARTAPMGPAGDSARSAAIQDSVTIALVPGDAQLLIRLRGMLVGDTLSGTWTAELLRTGAAGHFSMRRRRATP
jgi:hypothetical protein